MNTCPNCGKVLNEDEKILYKCMECKQQFKPQHTKYISSDNTIAKIIKICGIAIIVLGTISSFIIAGGDGYKYRFSFIRFLTPELISVISGLLFIGFAEIIKLLQDIKNKLYNKIEE